MELESKIPEEDLGAYEDILAIIKADRPPKNYQEAGNIAFEIRQLALFFKDMAFLMSDEDGGGSYLTEHKTLRAFRVLSQMFDILGVLSGNLGDWASIEEGRSFLAKRELAGLQKKEDEGRHLDKK